ncbi:MAG: hypothetical protein HPY82_18860 [Gammaproteobacteria bacterium]|nr:hypothetical protein [Gammaproteobacteria bacterium]
MQSILDSGYSWLLDSLKYQDGCLSIFLTELSRSATPENKTEGAPLDNCFAVKASESSRKVCVKWERPITWQVVNESVDAKEPDIVFKSHGFLSEIEKSQYFDYVKVRFGWYSCISGDFRLFNVWTENEIIEIVASTEPVLSVT